MNEFSGKGHAAKGAEPGAEGSTGRRSDSTDFAGENSTFQEAPQGAGASTSGKREEEFSSKAREVSLLAVGRSADPAGGPGDFEPASFLAARVVCGPSPATGHYCVPGGQRCGAAA